ncbi:hypothetical protein UlMin_019492 [Ulmus minor]
MGKFSIQIRFLREDSSSSSVRTRFEKMIRDAQDSVFQAIEAADGGGKIKEDVWSRPGVGGGISRVLQDGAIWERAEVNDSNPFSPTLHFNYRFFETDAPQDYFDFSFHKPSEIHESDV